MAQKALLLGGTGKTGVVLGRRLAQLGWEVRLASRGELPVPEGFDHVSLDRSDTAALRSALRDGVDVLVDFVAFEPEHASQLLELRGLVRSLVVISSAAVYTDEQGRSLADVREGETVRFPVPIPERHRTVEAGGEDYAAKKVAIERTLLGQDFVPVTIVRAGAIYGPGDVYSREWHFVKRALDSRPVVILAHRGESRFHPVSTENLAELLRLAAERPRTRVLNAGDPDPPIVLEIGRAIARVLEHEWTEILLPGPPHEEVVGGNPWGVPAPFVLDMTEAEFEVGYRPVTSYEKAVRPTCEWLVEATRGRDWREVLVGAGDHYAKLFDYEAEDDFLRKLTADSGGPTGSRGVARRPAGRPKPRS